MSRHDNRRHGDSSGASPKWTSGHNGENEDRRVGRKATPKVKPSPMANGRKQKGGRKR